jgi:ribulose-5-phosphate 4-epimerase/fuculose-1-phosphate aldolase
LLTIGKTAAEAFLSMYILERACRIQILAQSGRSTLLQVSEPILENVATQLSAVTVGLGAQLAWPGLLRKLDRIDPSYRE